MSEDGFLSLMSENGDTKDDVKVPDGEVGDKIEKLFRTEEKDTSKLELMYFWQHLADLSKMLLFLLPWVRRSPLRPRKLQNLEHPSKSYDMTSTYG